MKWYTHVITIREHCLYPSLCSFVYGVNSLQNPGQYFIKPLLREFEFSPASKVPEPCLSCHKYLLCIVYNISHLGSRGKRRPQWGHHIHWYKSGFQVSSSLTKRPTYRECHWCAVCFVLVIMDSAPNVSLSVTACVCLAHIAAQERWLHLIDNPWKVL